MLEIIGFVALNLLLVAVSLTVLILAFDATGKYNIGGVPNGLWKRIVSSVAILSLPLPWYFLWGASPFVIHLRG